MKLSIAEELIKTNNKYPSEIIDIINYYLSGQISRGRLAEMFDKYVDLNLLESAKYSLDKFKEIKKIVI